MTMMCEVLQVSRSGYYAWEERRPSAQERERKREALGRKIEAIHAESRGTYGSRRVHYELNVGRGEGERVNRKRVEKIMKELNLQGRKRPKFKGPKATAPEHPIAENILARDFVAEEPDQKWAADITYIRTTQGWLYLAVILDLFSRRVIGWSMADHMRKELVLDALKAALGHRCPAEDGLLMHTDQGSQYTSNAHCEALETAGITVSMSRRGECWDNAVVESFNSTLKTELVYRTIFLTRDSARIAIAEWIECFYNRRRRHSTLGYATPIEFEERFYEEMPTLAA